MSESTIQNILCKYISLCTVTRRRRGGHSLALRLLRCPDLRLENQKDSEDGAASEWSPPLQNPQLMAAAMNIFKYSNLV